MCGNIFSVYHVVWFPGIVLLICVGNISSVYHVVWFPGIVLLICVVKYLAYIMLFGFQE